MTSFGVPLRAVGLAALVLSLVATATGQEPTRPADAESPPHDAHASHGSMAGTVLRSFTSPDGAFVIKPPAGWRTFTSDELGHRPGQGMQVVVFTQGMDSPLLPQLWLYWTRLPSVPHVFELTGGELTEHDRQRIRHDVVRAGSVIVEERDDRIAGCPAHVTVLRRTGFGGRMEWVSMVLCPGTMLLARAFSTPEQFESLMQASAEAVGSLKFRSADRVPYIVKDGSFAIVPPVHWAIVDWTIAGAKGTDSSDRHSIEFHATSGLLLPEEAARHRLPYVRIQWQPWGLPETSPALLESAANMYFDQRFKEWVEPLSHGPARIGDRYAAHEWTVRRAERGGREIRGDLLTFVAGGRKFTVHFRASPDEYGKLREEARRCINSFRLVE